VLGNSTEFKNEALKEAVIGKSPLALAYIVPSAVPQNDTSSWNKAADIGKKAVSTEFVTIVPSTSLTDSITEREGNIEADTTGWNKSFTGV